MNSRQRVRDIVTSMKKDGCVKCGEKDVACLDYHHVKPEEKRFTLSCRATKRRPLTIVREIAKCVVLCSNCHRKHHYYGDYMRFRRPTVKNLSRRLARVAREGLIDEATKARWVESLREDVQSPGPRKGVRIQQRTH